MLRKQHLFFTYFLVCEGPSNDVVGVAGGTVFQKISPRAGFKTGDFVTEKLGELPCNDSRGNVGLRVGPDV